MHIVLVILALLGENNTDGQIERYENINILFTINNCAFIDFDEFDRIYIFIFILVNSFMLIVDNVNKGTSNRSYFLEQYI